MMGHPPGASLHEGSEQSLHGLLPRFLFQGGVGRGDHRIEAMIPKVNELASNKVVVVADPISTGCCDLRGFQCGYKVIRGWSVEASPEMRTHAPQSSEHCLLGDARARVYLGGDRCCKKAADNLQLSAVTVGGESGADYHVESLELRSVEVVFKHHTLPRVSSISSISQRREGQEKHTEFWQQQKSRK